jgi:hypothetical protein
MGNARANAQALTQGRVSRLLADSRPALYFE